MFFVVRHPSQKEKKNGFKRKQAILFAFRWSSGAVILQVKVENHDSTNPGWQKATGFR